MRWEPILVGDLAGAARSAIDEVARAVGEQPGARRTAMDLALFWAYVSGASDDAWSAARYDEACSELCSALSSPGSLALQGGLTGTAWVLAHISEPGSADEHLADVDDAMSRALDTEHWTAEYDLISGLVGYGIYFVERASAGAPAAVPGLRRIVDHLLATSEDTGEGVAWHTAPTLLPAWQLEGSPEGHFNCGLAHGVPGVIGLLGRIATLDCDPRVRPLCEDAMRWVRAQQLEEGGAGRYPDFRTRGERPRRPARTAWCYGDPGVAIAGWGAAVRLGRSADEWYELASASARRDPALCGVVDAAICHGSAGLAHIYNRCYHASGDPVFRDAACAWFRRTLEMRRERRSDSWPSSAGLLDGATGVALALLAAIEPVEPRWDRLMLCDLPLAQS